VGTYYTTTALATYLIGANTADTATANVMADSIDSAESEIAKYLSKRYSVGDWTTAALAPPIVKTWAQWLSAGFYYEVVGRGSKESFKRSDRLINRAVDNLKLVNSGELDILDTSGSSITEDSSPYEVYSNTDDYSPTFNEDTNTAWKVDSTKLEDIASSRS